MNRIVLPNLESPQVISDQTIVKHIQKVLRAKPGDELKYVIPNQALAHGKIKEINKDQVKISIDRVYSGTDSRHHLILPYCRPLTMQKVFEYGTSLGISLFTIFPATLAEKSFQTSKLFQNQNFSKYFTKGLSQSGVYYQIPEIQFLKNLDFNFLEKISGQKLLCSLNTQKKMNELKLDSRTAKTLAIGPERGFTTEEEETFCQAEFTKVSIFESILRVEAAVIVAFGQMHLAEK